MPAALGPVGASAMSGEGSRTVPERWGLCGWFGDVELAEPPGLVLTDMARDFSSHPDRGRSVARPRAAVHVSPGTPGGDLAEDGDLVAALAGTPSWSEPGLAALAARRGSASALLHAYKEHGERLLDHLRGAFALAVLDRERDRALVAIDRLGIHTMNIAPQPGKGLVFATTATAVARHPAASAAISAQGLFNYLFFYRVPAPGSIFRDQEKLLPAQFVAIDRGLVHRRFYWQMPFRDGSGAEFAALKAELFARLRQAVRRAAAKEDAERLGCFLSGGIDSSTVSGLLAELTPGPAKAFTIGFDCPGYDETAFAEAAARHFGLDFHHYTVTPDDVLDAVPRIAGSYDEPFGNASAVGVYHCARHAREHGIATLIAGDGGDELFAGNKIYLHMKRFELYHLLAESVRRRLVEPMIRLLPGGDRNVLKRKARRYVDQANMPMPDRMFAHEFERLAEVRQILDPEIAAAVDPRQPIAILREVYWRPASAAVEQRMHQLDLQITLADNDLRKVNRMCSLAGIAVRYPMLDEDVVEFSAGIPPALFMRGLRLRAFFKRAMADFLPKATLSKQKQGFGLPFGPWLAQGTPLRELAYESLTSLERRGLIRAEFIGTVRREHERNAHPLFAAPIWDLMCLEQWFQARIDAPTTVVKSSTGRAAV